MEIDFKLFILIAFLSMLFEFMDASIGMGFGTTLTPVLLLFKFVPLQVIPSVLLSQLLGGVIGGIAHYKFENIKLDFRNDRESVNIKFKKFLYIPRSFDSKVISILGVFGLVGAIIGVLIAVNIPGIVLNIYIGAMVLAIGIWILVKRNKTVLFSWKKLTLIGVVSAFNKGISGGGYGPLITGGQIISGCKTRNSIGSTTFVEPLICLVAFIGYLIANRSFNWPLIFATSIGSLIAAPFAAFFVKKVNSSLLRLLIGIVTILLGSYTILRIFI